MERQHLVVKIYLLVSNRLVLVNYRLQLVDLSLNCNTLNLMTTYQFSTIAH